jgi:toxin FitB
MKLLDTNIIIYSALPQFEYLQSLVLNPYNAVSTITYVESLGYHKLSVNDRIYLESVFQRIHILEVDKQVAEKAIELRQTSKMDLPDAIIAATALIYNVELITVNVKDFIHIPDLNITNPIDINK